MKTCSQCMTPKALSEFSPHSRNKDGVQAYCRVCGAASAKRARAARGKTINEQNRKRYRRMRDEILTHRKQRRETYEVACSVTYENIRARCEGRRGPDATAAYGGLPYCTRAEFFAWAALSENRTAWKTLRQAAAATGAYKDRPSIDRPDTSRSLGYVPGNMRWISHGDNSTRANQERWSKRRTCGQVTETL